MEFLDFSLNNTVGDNESNPNVWFRSQLNNKMGKFMYLRSILKNNWGIVAGWS